MYGVMGAKVTSNKDMPTNSLNKFCPGWTWADVTMVRTLDRVYVYPPGTTLVSEATSSKVIAAAKDDRDRTKIEPDNDVDLIP
jgi:hypothetical protein